MKPNGNWMRQNSWRMTIALPAAMASSTFLLDFDRNNTPYKNWPEVFLEILEELQGYSFWFLLISLAVWLFWQYRLKSSKNWVTVKALLGFMRDKVFQDTNGDPKHYHRVTLFVFTRYRWSYGSFLASIKHLFNSEQNGWLIPICRAGHLTQKSNAVFEVSDSGHYEGVCGKAWATCEVYVVGGLPRISSNSSISLIEEYASTTECTIESIETRVRLSKGDRDNCSIPRSIGAIPIVTDNSSAPKYVLVIDSRRPDGVPEDIGSHYTVVMQLLERLLGDSE